MSLLKQIKKVPVELLEENVGYNPEDAETHGIVHLSGDNKTITIEDEEREVRHYSLVGVIDLLDYINHYPQQFGLFYKGKFYVSS
jgi:hypothetical protein